MTPYPRILSFALVMFAASAWPARAQDPAAAQPAPAAGVTTEQLQQILSELQAQGERIKELETELEAAREAALAAKGQPATPDAVKELAATARVPVGSTATAIPLGIAAAVSPSPPEQQAPHEHSMQLPGGGPVLKISGFADFNLEFGQDANPLIFPLGLQAHDTFQFGQLDLFASSQLSKTVSFLGEIVIGPGETTDEINVWGIDIERLEVTYRPSKYFAISGGRYHTSIGYYNTAYHHGTWFQTATGRPFMDYFEDSGGVLPVHGVGVSATGLVPGTGRLEMHWIAELSNGRSSDANLQSVQNFLSDKDHKAFNVAAFVKPEWAPGLQLGGSYYNDRMVPPGRPDVEQSIGSFYVVYMNSGWELLNEIVLLRNHAEGAEKKFHSPLGYTQVSRKFGKFRPYYRFQYVNIASNDPINIFTGRYESHSGGIRMDFTDYVALKAQYNRLYQRVVAPENGVDLQMSFTF